MAQTLSCLCTTGTKITDGAYPKTGTRPSALFSPPFFMPCPRPRRPPPPSTAVFYTILRPATNSRPNRRRRITAAAREGLGVFYLRRRSASLNETLNLEISVWRVVGLEKSCRNVAFISTFVPSCHRCIRPMPSFLFLHPSSLCLHISPHLSISACTPSRTCETTSTKPAAPSSQSLR